MAHVVERKFLGHRLLPGGGLGIAPQSLARAKERLRRITRRSRGVSMQQVIGEANEFIIGWVTFFRHATGAARPPPTRFWGLWENDQ